MSNNYNNIVKEGRPVVVPYKLMPFDLQIFDISCGRPKGRWSRQRGEPRFRLRYEVR